jgi:hypothetical protein
MIQASLDTITAELAVWGLAGKSCCHPNFPANANSSPIPIWQTSVGLETLSISGRCAFGRNIRYEPSCTSRTRARSESSSLSFNTVARGIVFLGCECEDQNRNMIHVFNRILARMRIQPFNLQFSDLKRRVAIQLAIVMPNGRSGRPKL